MNRQKTLYLANGGLIAALYVVLTLLAAAFGLASGAIQVRLSEALTILPVFTSAAVPGLAVGCVLANLITGCAAWDVVFGSLATLIGAVGTRLLKNKPLLAWIPPVVSNAAIVPIVLQKVYGVPDAWYAYTGQRTNLEVPKVATDDVKKCLENGQLIILKEGIKYTVLGLPMKKND